MEWILLFFDALGLWLLLRPSDLMNLWTARRIRVSDVGRFVVRFVGVILLSMQVTHWEAQAKNTSAEPVAHWFSIIFWIGAVVFLGYHFVRLFGSKPDGQTRVDQAKRRFLLPESEEEAGARYKAAWQKYRRLRIAFPLAFLGWLPFAGLLFEVFILFHWNLNVAMVIVLAWIPLIPIFGWQWSFWQCPRCGYAFKGATPFFPRRCFHCDLPIWAESPDA